jgi:hypothetical protein
MSTPEIQRGQGRGAARATTPSLTGSASPAAVLGSFATLIDHLVTVQTQLISSYLRLGSSLARRSRPATPTITTLHPRPDDDQPAPARAHSDPAPAPGTASIEARAYEIFVRRGRQPGNPVDDWQRAEAELRAEMTD